MAIRALTLSASFTHVLSTDPSFHAGKLVPVDPEDETKGMKREDDKIDADATVFHYHPLDVFVMSYIFDRSSIMSQTADGVDLKTRVNEANLDQVRFGVSKIDNLLDQNGNVVTFKMNRRAINGNTYNVLPDDVIGMLPIEDIIELSAKIKEKSEVDRKLEKN